MTPPNHIAAAVLQQIREQRPLVLCLTNSVVQNFTANLLLAVGAVPVMLNHAGEIEDLMHSCANALLINVGTLDKNQAQLMQTAVRCAGNANIPWVLDPVAVGLLRYRTLVCNELISANAPAMIRGNASEILGLLGITDSTARGTESTTTSSNVIIPAQMLARHASTTVLLTGETDYMTDGQDIYSCANGHELMTRVTGMGCAMGALAAACTAVANTPLHAAIATAAIMGTCGDIAANAAPHPGSLVPAFLDALDTISPTALQNLSKLAIL